MEKKRVLVGCITSDAKAYCQDRFLWQLTQLSYVNKNVIFVDNSETKDNCNKIVAAGFNCYYIPRKNKGVREIMAESSETLRQIAVNNGYDYLFNLESDLFLTPSQYGIIDLLMLQNKQVCAALYDMGDGSVRQLCVLLIDSLNEQYATYAVGRCDIMFVDGSVRDVYTAGIGACLIHRSVLTQFKFRIEPNQSSHPDMYAARDIADAGISFYADTSLFLEHDNRDWGTYKLDYE